MNIFNNSQITEQVTIYENKIKVITDKIKNELRIRRNLKEKLDEAKQREATQILILERLDEYEEIITKQLELVEKMEDSESVKQLAVIEKYESMLREQQQVWAQYEEEYEQLPLAKERQKAEVRLMRVTIQIKLIDYKIKEIERIIMMKERVKKKQEQLKTIEFAKLYLEHRKREEHCRELLAKVNNRRNKERELQREVQDLERQVAEKNKSNVILNKTSKISQQLPKIDLSCYIIRRDNYNYNNYDSVSLNSYMLEQEYMNSEEVVKESSQPESQPLAADSQPRISANSTESETMDFDDNQEHVADARRLIGPEKVSSEQRANGEDTRMDVDSDETYNTGESQANQLTMQSRERNSQPDKRTNFNPQMNKKSSQDSQPEHFQSASRSTPQKRQLQQQSGQADAPSRGVVVDERVGRSSPLRGHRDRPVPSPAKLQKQQRQSPPRRNPEVVFNTKDLARLPQASKPQTRPSDNSDYPAKQFQHLIQREQSSAGRAAPIPEVTPRIANPEQREPAQWSNPKPRQDGFVTGLQRQQQQQEHRETVTPMPHDSSIALSSMFNVTMASAEVSMDNISAILGSEITEPGGSFELARRLYADSDLNSEEGDYDYDKMMAKFCSPIPGDTRNSEIQHQPSKPNSQPHMNANNNAPATRSQEHNNENFSLEQFMKKRTDISQRLF